MIGTATLSDHGKVDIYSLHKYSLGLK